MCRSSYMVGLPTPFGARRAPPWGTRVVAAAADTGSLSARLRLTAVDKVDGEATHVVSRGKQRVVFEFTIKVRTRTHSLNTRTRHVHDTSSHPTRGSSSWSWSCGRATSYVRS